MASDLIDRAAKYAQSGRQHGSLTAAELEELWIKAYRALAASPKDKLCKITLYELCAEFHLRSVVAPLAAVLDGYITIEAYEAEKHRRYLAGGPEVVAQITREVQELMKVLSPASTTLKAN